MHRALEEEAAVTTLPAATATVAVVDVVIEAAFETAADFVLFE